MVLHKLLGILISVGKKMKLCGFRVTFILLRRKKNTVGKKQMANLWFKATYMLESGDYPTLPHDNQ